MVVYLLYQILLLISDRLSATIGCVVFLTLFAFPQFIGIGNYNFVCPYSHECTHGILLSLSGIWCLRIYLSRHGLLPIAAAGILLGLAFLTSAEMSSAACLAMATGLGLSLWQERTGSAPVIRVVSLFAGCAIIPPVDWFRPTLPEDAGRTRLSSACWVPGPAYPTGRHFPEVLPLTVMGTSNITASLEAILGWLGGYLLVFGIAAAVAFALPRRSANWFWLLPVVFAIVMGGLLVIWRSIAWLSAARPLPVLLIGIGITSLVKFVKRGRASPESASLIMRLTMLVYAFALLGKIILNVHVYHYGFALAMPATLITVAALLCWVPAAIDHARRKWRGFSRHSPRRLDDRHLRAPLCTTVLLPLENLSRLPGGGQHPGRSTRGNGYGSAG